ncbi:hypothetical protein BpHYR1_002504 [Brachionus plicatilis]|uniref:Uncharacterized protein n=1 Tax=Brachionus plicatilis TaxID=10195 RepID=A0A3M7S149_BRAPC|nr:hypothetical protein BpHYR1_002504 [Brachionus plicatilis]
MCEMIKLNERYFELGILFQHNQFLNSTMKKTFNTIRFLLSTKNLEVSEKLARTFLTVKLNFITPLIFVLNEFILFLIFVLKKKSFCAERFEIVLNVSIQERKIHDQASNTR